MSAVTGFGGEVGGLTERELAIIYLDHQAIEIVAAAHTERDYLELVDWAGRAIRADKRGAIPGHIPPILNRLGRCIALANSWSIHV